MATAGPALPTKTLLQETLECPLCLHQLENPHTLPTCLHSFCKVCLEEMPRKENDDGEQKKKGWNCPVCSSFSDEASLKQDEFLTDLIEIQHSHIGSKNAFCRQCLKDCKPEWRCDDCKIEICGECKLCHLRIPVSKDHNIVKMEEAHEKCVDKMAFCAGHNKILELNCKQCETPTCIVCNLKDHNGHKIESVPEALDRLLPKMVENSKVVNEQYEFLQNKIKVVRQKIEETKAASSNQKAELNKRMEELIKKIKSVTAQKNAELDDQEKAAVAELENIKQELENAASLRKKLAGKTEILLTYSKNMSQLKEIENGLFVKMSEISKTENTVLTLPIHVPQLLQMQDDKSICDRLHELLGKNSVKQTTSKFSPEGQLLDEHYLCDSFFKLFDRPMRKLMEVDLDRWGNRITYINGNIWVPLYNQIQLYDHSGSLVDTIECDYHPLAMTKCSTGGILIGAANGIYQYNQQSLECKQIGNQVESGVICDISGYGDLAVALDLYKNKVILFKHSETKDWSEEISFDASNLDTYTFSSILLTETGIHVATTDPYKIDCYSLKGKFIHSFSVDYGQLFLCGQDKEGDILISNFDTNELLVTDKSIKNVRKTISCHDLQQVSYVTIDSEGNIWALEGDDNLKLVKYTTKCA